ncbi:MAG: hypothetical protein ABI946_06860 [Chthoniobacterales bacterium]
MNQHQSNQVTMFQTTLDFLDANAAVWNGTPAFVDAVARAKTGLAGIDTTTDKQETPTQGIAGDKAALRDDLETKTLEIADQLSALAAKLGDHDLGQQVEMTKSSLDKLQDGELEQVAERVVTKATEHKGALGDYNVSNADIADLDAARLAFVAKKTAPRQAAVERKAMTSVLSEQLPAVRSIFRNELDKMVTKFKTANNTFYKGYFNARIIVDTGLAAPAAPTPPPGP